MEISGSIQNILTCKPSGPGQGTSALDNQLCPPHPDGTAFQLAVIQAYTVDARSEGALHAATAPFDYSQAVGFWSLAFSTVVVLWLVSTYAGEILAFIRRA